MGIFRKFKEIFRKNEEEYEKPYPNNIHKAMSSLDDIRDDNFQIDDPILTIDKIKQMEASAPTHWMWKFIKDPIEVNYRQRALDKSMLGRYDEVIKICKKGLNKFPDSPYLLYMFGRTLGDLGRCNGDVNNFSDGVNLLTQTIDQYPNFADAYVERGKIKVYLSDEDGAIRDFIQAREIEADINLPLSLDLKKSELELKKREVGRRFCELGIVNNLYSSGVPNETITLNQNGVSIVLDFLGENKYDYVLFGSFPLMASILPAFKRKPGDIDIQLWTSKIVAEKFSRDLFYLLKNGGEVVRLSPENPVIIESRKTGRWERAVDIHHKEEAPEDCLSPLYSLGSDAPAPFEDGGRDKGQALIDALDTFRIMKTSAELAKQNNIEMTKINEVEILINQWKDLFSEFIDFEKLEIIGE